MSDLGFNKVAGAVLATGLAIFGLRELSSMIYEKEPVTKPGYAIAVQEDAGEGGAAAAEVPPDWGTVLPVADVKAGEGVHQKCLSCHNFDPSGANGTGPGLYGVVMRKPGSHPGFAYSAAMTEFGGKNPAWTYDQLDQFLKAPQVHVPGTKMTFVGLKKQEDRINIIAFLRTLAPSPAAIPAPNPKAAAPAGSDAAPAASGAASVVASGSTASNAGAQQAAPSSGPAAAPTQVTKPTRAEG